MKSNFTYHENILIKKCLAGDRKGQKEIYLMFSNKMFGICLRYAKNQMDAEDILQEGFLKLFNNLHKYRGEGSFEGWVRRIFVNTAIEHLRKKIAVTVLINEVDYAIVDNNKTALENLYERDILNLTNKLSEGYKKVFNLYAVEGYSHKEISVGLGITESTSKSQFSRAKSALRNIISGNANKCKSELVM